MKVFLHTRKSPGVDGNWINTDEEFAGVPRVGEYIAKENDTPFWYLVDLVVWIPKSMNSEYDAEVYAVEVDHLDAHRLAHAHGDSQVAAASRREA